MEEFLSLVQPRFPLGLNEREITASERDRSCKSFIFKAMWEPMNAIGGVVRLGRLGTAPKTILGSKLRTGGHPAIPAGDVELRSNDIFSRLRSSL